MDDRARKFIAMVLKAEGGYSAGTGKMSADKGKETYCGISRVAHPGWDGWKIVDAKKPLKYNQKIKDSALEANVEKFYYDNYYLKMKADKVQNDCIAAHIFCHGVNAGVYQGVKLLQKAINKACGVSIAVDGKIGPQTLQHADGAKQNAVLKELVRQRESFYRGLAAKNSSQKRFLNGWLNRVKETTKTCSGTSSPSWLYFTGGSSGGSVVSKVLGWLFDKLVSKI